MDAASTENRNVRVWVYCDMHCRFNTKGMCTADAISISNQPYGDTGTCHDFTYDEEAYQKQNP